MERATTHGESDHYTTDAGGGSSPSSPSIFRFPLHPAAPQNRGSRRRRIWRQGDRRRGQPGFVRFGGEHICPNSSMPNTTSKVVCVFMHPAAVMNMLPFLLRWPVPVATLSPATRYANFDFNLILENCLRDLNAVVSYCKSTLNFDRVVLIGWSGGGSLVTYYQSEAENPVLGLDLDPADALICVAAHAGRARVLTECLDPSVWLHGETPNVHKKHLNLQEFNLYSQEYQNDPDLLSARLACPQFLARFRQAQMARNKRITSWAACSSRREFRCGRHNDGPQMDFS